MENTSIRWKTAIVVSACIAIRIQRHANSISAVVLRKSELRWLGLSTALYRGQKYAGRNK